MRLLRNELGRGHLLAVPDLSLGMGGKAMILYYCGKTNVVQGCLSKVFGNDEVRMRCTHCPLPCEAKFAKVEMHPCECGGRDAKRR